MNWTAVYTCGRRGPLTHGVHTETIESETTHQAWELAKANAPAERFWLCGAETHDHAGIKTSIELGLLAERMIPQYVKSPEAMIETFGYDERGHRKKVSVRFRIATSTLGCLGYLSEQECAEMGMDRRHKIPGLGQIFMGGGVPVFFNTGQVGGDGNSFEWFGRVDSMSYNLKDYIIAKSKKKDLDHDFIKVCEWGRHHFHTEFKEHFAPGPETLAEMEKMIAKHS